MDRLINIQKVLEENSILTCFSGRFSQRLIEEMGEAIKEHMQRDKKNKSQIYNVFSIFIEQCQNIRNYTLSKQGQDSYFEIAESSIVCIGKNNDNYFIWSGNVVENIDVDPLIQWLSLIKNSSKDELKELYKDKIKNSCEISDNGAGVGLISIARKSSRPIEYSFKEVNHGFSFYELKVSI